ncbi:hypothetical protein CSKR_202462 [Clonorchis sinensis]|uniref:Uncharacterized protein n=1 Tax=Clonorchis sinensis TaxID=79923 RepID=A0A8T1MV47_CLOSI|nr:hypothetical protein CSKR_202462 [Clonorchis sinensis]
MPVFRKRSGRSASSCDHVGCCISTVGAKLARANISTAELRSRTADLDKLLTNRRLRQFPSKRPTPQSAYGHGKSLHIFKKGGENDEVYMRFQAARRWLHSSSHQITHV